MKPFMVTARVLCNSIFAEAYGIKARREIHMMFDNKEQFEKWHLENKEAEITRTSETHKNAYEPEELSRRK